MSTAVIPRAFEHDALFYDDVDAFVAQVGDYVREGLEADDAVLVATDATKCGALRDHLGSLADVSFVDMASIGRNPGRIIAVWRDFLDSSLASGRAVRGVGEPVWPSRSAEALVECQHHESLLNLAFDDGPAWKLLCPYDVASLPETVLHEAMLSHRAVRTDGVRRASDQYVEAAAISDKLAVPLAEPAAPVAEFVFTGDGLAELRDEALRRAKRAGVARERLDDVALAVHELATNSVRYGGAGGTARFWSTPASFYAEIRDAGHITDPLVGRAKPPLGAEGGRGLWLTHQLCDLVQLRTSSEGTVVRVSIDIGGRA